MSRSRNPDGCYFVDFYKVDIGCPYQFIGRNPKVAKLYEFVSKTMDTWETTDEFDKKRKIKNYGMSIEKFNWAAQLHMIKDEDLLEAVSWSSVAAKAANEAKDVARLQERKKRWG